MDRDLLVQQQQQKKDYTCLIKMSCRPSTLHLLFVWIDKLILLLRVS